MPRWWFRSNGEGLAGWSDESTAGIQDRPVLRHSGRSAVLDNASEESLSRPHDGDGPLHRAADLQLAALRTTPGRNRGCRDHVDDTRAGEFPGESSLPRCPHAVAQLAPHARPGPVG